MIHVSFTTGRSSGAVGCGILLQLVFVPKVKIYNTEFSSISWGPDKGPMFLKKTLNALREVKRYLPMCQPRFSLA